MLSFVQPPPYQTQLHAFLRRPALRLSICTRNSCRLLVLPSGATLNDVFRQLDTPRETVILHLPDGRAVPRTDEFLSHYLQRCQQDPYQRKPQVWRLLAIPLSLVDLAPAALAETTIEAAPAAA